MSSLGYSRIKKAFSLIRFFNLEIHSSSLHAKVNGKLRYKNVNGYFFNQDFLYMTPEGVEHAAQLDVGLNLKEKSFYSVVSTFFYSYH